MRVERVLKGLGPIGDWCIVVEDSPFGVAGAKAAGMAALGFAAATASVRLDGADAVFTTMADLPGLFADTG